MACGDFHKTEVKNDLHGGLVCEEEPGLTVALGLATGWTGSNQFFNMGPSGSPQYFAIGVSSVLTP